MSSSQDKRRTRQGVKKSKFEEHGARVYQSLLNLQDDEGATPGVHQHQIEAVLKTKNMMNYVAYKKQPAPVLIVAPPGSGRSGMMVLLAYALQPKKVLILTPSTDRSTRIGIAFGTDGAPSSFIQRSGLISSKRTVTKMLEPVLSVESPKSIKKEEETINVVIVKGQTIWNPSEAVGSIEEFFQGFDLLLVDDAHHFPASIWKRVLEEFGMSLERKVVFLSATSETSVGLPILPTQQVACTILREEIEGVSIRPCDFEEFDKSVCIDDIRDILERQQQQEGRIKHQALILVQVSYECDYLVDTLNGGDDASYAVGIYTGKTKDQKLKDFKAGKYRVAVVAGYLPDDYDDVKVSLCVILRNVSSPLFFSHFIGKCLRMVDFPDDEAKDRTRACVLTSKKFEQVQLWNDRDALVAESHRLVDGVGGQKGNVSVEQESNEDKTTASAKRKIDSEPSSSVKRSKTTLGENDDAASEEEQNESDEDDSNEELDHDLSSTEDDGWSDTDNEMEEEEASLENDESDNEGSNVEVAQPQEEPKIFTSALAILLKIPGMTEVTMCMSWCSTLKLLDSQEDEYRDIVEYIKNGQVHKYGVKLLNVLRLIRTKDPEFDLDPARRKMFRMLLWHGTEMKNIPSILQNGFQLPPGNQQMFGTGIYFADRISKSCNYCNPTTFGSVVYVLLCDVLLGNVYNAKNPNNELTEPPTGFRQGFDSVMCTGKFVPDRAANRRLRNEEDGSIIPCGPTIENKKFPSYTVMYNEYVVYDPAKIKIKYLAQVEFTRAVCSYS